MAHTKPLSITIPARGYAELEQIAIHAARLRDVLDATAGLPVNVVTSDAGQHVAERIGIAPSDASLLLTGLASLRSMQDSVDSTAEEVVKAITESLAEAPGDWHSKNYQRWLESEDLVRTALASIGPDHPLLVRQKARGLTYAHQYIFRSCRIITDLRPVFNEAGDDINAMVLTHVLRIEYFDGVRKQRIEFALDEADINDLERATKRAKVKTETTRAAFAGEQWSLIVAGERAAGE
ncbi:MAG TPA: hypothetical protein VH518_16230 [Tepidisphaeraceae bacterium]